MTPRRRGSRGAAGRLAVVSGLTLSALAVLAAWTYFAPGPGSGKPGAEVVLDRGVGLSGIAKSLDDAHIIRSRAAFMTAAVMTGASHRLKAGEYAFPTGASLASVLSMIERGAVVRHFITLPEGQTSRAAVAILLAAPFLTGPASVPPEGSLLPETYEVGRGDSRAGVIARMRAAQRTLLDRLWSQRAPGLPYQSREQAVTLASIVEKETALTSERPRIAAVFINRLKKGMRLESDPTVIYAVSAGVPLGHGLRKSELASLSPYNTYRQAGLPPTPIANPGAAALSAALDPARTDDLFFVADGAGGHVFAATFDAHRRNVEKWRRVEPHGAGA